MSGDRRALLMMVTLLSGCLVLADDGFEIGGRIIPGVINVWASPGEPAALTCDLSGSFANFGWRKIDGPPTSEENLRKLTKTWRFNETYSRIGLYFPNASEHDDGLYECWAKDHKNLTKRSERRFVVHRVVSLKKISVAALDASRIGVKWSNLQEDIIAVHPALVIQIQKNGSLEWHREYETTTSTSSGAFIATACNPDTAYWFKFILMSKIGNPVFVPLVWVKETSVDSITIEWSKPPREIESIFNYYQVTTYETGISGVKHITAILWTGDNYKKFKNLTTSVSYQFQLDLCFDIVCNPKLYPSTWSENVVPKDRGIDTTLTDMHL
ncbi:tyrosine-protein phosphatase 69D-like [Neodiprion lecontei]|uniref:Tyrosine-protein phosphatase 69D-like n=1 Tax=Neodiprion lecontei TaxID=441921 RepID=A0ABM3GCF4_NEOLC|nr:tyrosine-protein phosphatase 69D-like [Neodiprion lecontei]